MLPQLRCFRTCITSSPATVLKATSLFRISRPHRKPTHSTPHTAGEDFPGTTNPPQNPRRNTSLTGNEHFNYPKLSLLSKSFHSLPSSSDIYKTRSQIGTTETCFYICFSSDDFDSYHWFTLHPKPDRTQTETELSKKKSSGNVLVPMLPFSSSSVSVPCDSTIAVGSEIYVIGGWCEPSTAVRVLDCRSNTWRNAPNMKVARDEAFSVSLEDKIYVMGGYENDPSDHWLEVFDIKTQSWTSIPSPFDKPTQFTIVNVIHGKLHVITPGNEYTYDPKQGTWKFVREFTREILLRWCSVDNVICCCTVDEDCMWYDIEGGTCQMIKGLEKLREHPEYGLSTATVSALVNYCGNLLVIWEPWEREQNQRKFWYAEISLEKRCNGSEVWGNVEWVDVMFTLPNNSYNLEFSVNVSV